mmetsp:Transcript_5286/g.6231  ORF Transcript_5286/g.6231 Transcript_5286/m.6231 type:complete len:453 (-) Transcript_5286:10-1368(-)
MTREFASAITSKKANYRVVVEPSEYYKISSLIADGGFAFVYKGIRKEKRQFHRKRPKRNEKDANNDDTPLAIKVFTNISETNSSHSRLMLLQHQPGKKYYDPDQGTSLEAIRNEVAILQALRNSEYIVKIHEAVYTNSRDKEFWIITDFCDYDLSKVIKYTGKGLSMPQLEVVASCIALAIQHMHSKNIIHGDIKGSNILLSANGLVKVCDFGLSKSVTRRKQKLVCGNRFTGTPSFSAPELFASVGSGYSFPIDIWSFACTIFQMKMRSSPFERSVFPPYRINSMNDISNFYANYDDTGTNTNEYDNVWYFSCGLADGSVLSEDEKAEIIDQEVVDVEEFDAQTRLVTDFARTCIIKDPHARPTMKQILSTAFFKDTAKALKKHPLSSDVNFEFQDIIRQLVEDVNSANYVRGAEGAEGSTRKKDKYGFSHYHTIASQTDVYSTFGSNLGM